MKRFDNHYQLVGNFEQDLSHFGPLICRPISFSFGGGLSGGPKLGRGVIKDTQGSLGCMESAIITKLHGAIDGPYGVHMGWPLLMLFTRLESMPDIHKPSIVSVWGHVDFLSFFYFFGGGTHDECDHLANFFHQVERRSHSRESNRQPLRLVLHTSPITSSSLGSSWADPSWIPWDLNVWFSPCT